MKAKSNVVKPGRYMLMVTNAEQVVSKTPRPDGHYGVAVNFRFETQNGENVWNRYQLGINELGEEIEGLSTVPLYLLLRAITGNNEEATYLLDHIDWEVPQDVEVLFNRPIIGEVTLSPEYGNGVGRVEHPKPLPVA